MYKKLACLFALGDFHSVFLLISSSLLSTFQQPLKRAFTVETATSLSTYYTMEHPVDLGRGHYDVTGISKPIGPQPPSTK